MKLYRAWLRPVRNPPCPENPTHNGPRLPMRRRSVPVSGRAHAGRPNHIQSSGGVPGLQNRPPPLPSICRSTRAHQGAKPAPPCPICPFRSLARPPSAPFAAKGALHPPASSYPLSAKKNRKTIIGIGKTTRPTYLFNNSLAFLWPRSVIDRSVIDRSVIDRSVIDRSVIDRSAPDSPPKTKVRRESEAAPTPKSCESNQ